MVAVGAVQHFLFCICHRPALINNAVHSRNQSRAVGAVVAMNQYGTLLLLFFNQIQRLRNIFRLDAPRTQRAVEQRQPAVFQVGVVVVAVEITQVDDAFDAEFLNRVPVVRHGLLAAVQFVVDAVQVRILLYRSRPAAPFFRRHGRRIGGKGRQGQGEKQQGENGAHEMSLINEIGGLY